jgi:tRNA A-37 threonylcarbamoyl transferase component Bud32
VRTRPGRSHSRPADLHNHGQNTAGSRLADPAVFWCTVRRVVGISVIEQGSFVADRYRVVERLTRFAIADSALTGVEYAYWLALDETRGVEVWLQVAESRGTIASGAELAGVVAALRRLNHPAVPAVLDFGEIEVEITAEAEISDADVQDEDERDEDEIVVMAVGYVVLEPVEAESLATVLLRGALTEAEVLAALVEIADVLKVLHEVELVHGHLSAYSFLLTERSVLLIDLAAALALETASGSELTEAADVYALAWLACIALAGVETVEAEFGVGFDAGSSPESAAAPQLLTVDLVERRRAWAAANLIATYGVRAELAALLIAALGEASGRPTAAAVAAALRVREDVSGAAAGVAVGAAAAGAAAVLAAAEVVEVAEAAQAVEAVEVIEAAEAEIVAAAAVVEAEEAEEAEQIEVAEVVETAETSWAPGNFVGAGVGAGAAMGAEAMAGGTRGGGGGAGTATAFASAPVSPPSAPTAGRHSSPPRRPRSAMYVAIAIVVLIIVAIAWGCSAGGTSNSVKPTAPATTGGPAGQASASAGGGASPSATAGQGAASPSASASAGTGSSATAAAPGGGGTPGYTATPLATAPASPGQALQQIQQTVSQAQSAGQLPQQATGPLNQAIGTLQQEIAGKSSVQQGISQLRSALNTPGVPSGFATQINELIPYLVAGQGS